MLVLAGLAACDDEPKAVADQPVTASASTQSASHAPPDASASGCSRRFDALEVEAFRALPLATISELLRARPSEGVFRTRGRPVAWHPCPACPPGAVCKPCEISIVLSDAEPGADGAGHELRIHVPKPSAFHRGKTYDVGLEVCAGASPVGELLHVEVRGAWLAQEP